PTEVAEIPPPPVRQTRPVSETPPQKEEPAATAPAKKEEPAAATAKKEEPALPVLPAGGPATANEVYQYTLKSVAWIFVPIDAQRAATGTGTLVDRQNRLVLTNYHVVATGQGLAAVLFPPYHADGSLITEKEAYGRRVQEQFKESQGQNKEAGVYKGTVVKQDPKRDLALIQLDRVPDSIETMRLASSNPQVGQK